MDDRGQVAWDPWASTFVLVTGFISIAAFRGDMILADWPYYLLVILIGGVVFHYEYKHTHPGS